jgi:hypothetical protein
MVEFINRTNTRTNTYTNDDLSSIFDGDEPGLHFGISHFSWVYVLVLVSLASFGCGCFYFAYQLLGIVKMMICEACILWQMQLFGVLSMGAVQSSRTTLDDNGRPLSYHATVLLSMDPLFTLERSNTHNSLSLNHMTEFERRDAVSATVVEVIVSAEIYDELVETHQLRMILHPTVPSKSSPEYSLKQPFQTCGMIVTAFFFMTLATWFIFVPFYVFMFLVGPHISSSHLFLLTNQLILLYGSITLCSCLWDGLISIYFCYFRALATICHDYNHQSDDHHMDSALESVELISTPVRDLQLHFDVSLPK